MHKVKKAEKDFNEADTNLRDFEHGETDLECPHCKAELTVDNDEILTEWRKLASIREAAKDHAVAVARQVGANICGMQAVSSIDRAYDTEALWNGLEDNPELRSMIVKTKLSVDTAAFDQAVRTGGISDELREKVVVRDGIKYTMRKQPSSIKIG